MSIVYQNIQKAQTADNLQEVYFQLGRLSYMLLTFEPVQQATMQHNMTINVSDSNFHKVPQALMVPVECAQNVATGVLQFLNATGQSFNSSLCLGNLSLLNTSVSEVEKKVQRREFYALGTSLEGILNLIYPITVACYYTAFDYVATMEEDLQTLTNLSAVTYNVFHNGP